MARAGSELVSLLPTRIDWWFGVLEDLVESSKVKELESRFIDKLQVSLDMLWSG